MKPNERMARVRSEKLRLIILRDGPTCWLCRGTPKGKQRTLDHVIPRSRGGTSGIDNLRVACKRCNNRRGDAPPPWASSGLTTDQRIALQAQGEGP